ncbi:hypothetical protein ACTPL8_002106 [Enterococcus faecium]
MFEKIKHIENLYIPDEKQYVNELLENGWTLLNIIQNSDDSFSQGYYVIGADEQTFNKINLQSILEKERMLETEKIEKQLKESYRQ